MTGRSLFRQLTSLPQQRRGSAVPLVALSLTALFGASALTVDMTVWRLDKEKLQRTVDAAAIAITRARVEGGNSAADAKRLALVELNYAGFNATQNLAVDVSLKDDESLTISASIDSKSYFGGPLNIIAPRLTASAGVTGALSGTPLCFVGMSNEPRAKRGLSVETGALVDITTCRMHSNSMDAAVTVGGMEGSITIDNARVRSASLCAVGGIAVRGPQAPVGTRHEGCEPVQDPLGHFAEPIATGTCVANPATEARWSGTRTLDPGNYCNGLGLPPGTKARFASGVYYVSGGDLDFRGADPWSGSRVGFAITGPGTVYWDETSKVSNFSAPTSGPMAGVFIWRTRAHACDNPLVFSGRTARTLLKVDGAIYAPNCEIRFEDKIRLQTLNRFTIIAGETVTASTEAEIKIHASRPYGEAICRPVGTGPVKLMRPT